MTNLLRITGLFIIILLAACNGLAGEPVIIGTVPPQPTIDTSNPEASGANIFAARCASCHGETGRGDGAVAIEAGLEPPDFTQASTSADQSLTQWTNTIRFGRIESMMPPWENSLTAEEIEAVAEYTFTLWQDFPQNTTENEEPAAETTEQVIPEAIGSVSGEIIQGTAGAPLPDIISVALHVIDSDGNEANFEMQVLQEGTTYAFEGILIRHDYSYVLTAIYQDVVFYSELVSGTPDSPDMILPVTIYEVTDDDSVIEIDLYLMRVIPSGEELVLQQLINFANTSDRVYRGSNQIDSFTYDSVRIPIPDGAEILNSVDLVPRFLMLEGETQPTILDTQPVLPGNDHLVEILYTMPFPIDASRVTIEFPTRYNLAQSIEVMVQPSELIIESNMLTSTGTQHFSVGVYESYLSEVLPANSQIAFDVLPAPDEADIARAASRQRTMVVTMAFAGVALMTISGMFLLFGRKNQAAPEA